MIVPPLDLVKQYRPLKSSLIDAFSEALDSGQFVLGDKVESFEKSIEELTKAKYAIAVSNGTDALWLALKAAGVGPGDYVATTPFTFFATVSAICKVGARPVFCDIDEATFNLDPTDFQHVVNTFPGVIKAVIPVHLYGQCADMAKITEIASTNNIKVIEDAAQALGSTQANTFAGAFGDAACFSLFPTKNLGALGEAGLVTTNSDEIANTVRKLRVHGSSQRYLHEELGSNCRMDAIQAAFLLQFIPKLKEWNEAREFRAERYNEAFAEIAEITLPQKKPGNSHIYHQYTIRVGAQIRDSLKTSLQNAGIGAAVYYPLPCHLQPALQGLVDSSISFPKTEKASSEVLSLPVFPTMSGEQQHYVITMVHRAIKELRPLVSTRPAKKPGANHETHA